MQVSESLNEGPVGTDWLVVPLCQEDADVSGVHLLVNGYHLGAAINIVNLQHHL